MYEVKREKDLILKSLEIAIITKTDNKLGFCNIKGQNILDQISAI